MQVWADYNVSFMVVQILSAELCFPSPLQCIRRGPNRTIERWAHVLDPFSHTGFSQSSASYYQPRQTMTVEIFLLNDLPHRFELRFPSFPVGPDVRRTVRRDG
jgi:hypothetical protein